MTKVRRVTPTVILVFATLPFLYPLFFLISTAIRPQAEYLDDPIGFPQGFTWEHLSYAWHTADLGNSIVNSLIAVSVSVVVLAVISTAGAFWFLRHTGRIARMTFWVLVSMWLVPWVVWILPLFVGLSDFNLTNDLIVLGVVLATINAPFGLYFMTAYLRSGLPGEVLEAARADGATLLQQFRLVVVPLARPALGTIIALGFVWAWGDLFISVILLQEPAKYTETIAAAGLVGIYRASVQETAAAAIIAILPLILVFGLAQRAIVRGFTAGFGK